MGAKSLGIGWRRLADGHIMARACLSCSVMHRWSRMVMERDMGFNQELVLGVEGMV